MRTIGRSTRRSRVQLWLAVVVGGSCLLLQSAHATLFFQEGFNYTAGTPLHGNDGWSRGSTGLTITNASLTYPGLAGTSPSGNALLDVSGSGTFTVNMYNATSNTAGTVYFSFLLSPVLLSSASNQEVAALVPDNGTPNGGVDALGVYVGAGSFNGTYQIGVRHNGSDATYVNTAAMTLGSTNFFVVAYTFNPGTSDDVVSLWVNPTPGGSRPAADATMSGGTDAANLDKIEFKSPSSSTGGNWVFDTLRIGDAWADVTPVPEPSTFALMGFGLGLMAAMIRRRR